MARANFLSQERSDIKLAVRELSRAMAKPTNSDWDQLIHLARYLKGKERYIQSFDYQESTAADSNMVITVWTDTDYAGCPVTRKSTRGGVCMLNNHTIKAWCVIQTSIARSSGEAEYYGMVRGAAQGLGIQSLLRDLGIERKIKLKTDASVAKAISSRRGPGELRHVEVNQLWLQEKVKNGKRK